MDKRKRLIAIIATLALLCFPVTSFAEGQSTDTEEQDVVIAQGDDEAGDCEHEWVKLSCSKLDGNQHVAEYKCTKCNSTKTENENHNWHDDYFHSYYDEYYGEKVNYCEDCDERKIVKTAHSFDFSTAYSCTKIDANYHSWSGWCNDCYNEAKIKEKHTYKITNSATKVNGTYHQRIYKCPYCGATKKGANEKHSWVSYCAQKATIKKKGVLKYKCRYCGAPGTTQKTFSWKFDANGDYSDYYIYYDIIDHSNVFQKSKSMTVHLENPLKGAVIKVTINKKTFKKKIKNNKKKQKIKLKLKKNSYGKAIKIKVYYKGKLVGADYCDEDSDTYDYVFYAKDIKRGMTKKQVKNLYWWGSPDESSSYSDGKHTWTYWTYEDESWIEFKDGKARAWYDAAR